MDNDYRPLQVDMSPRWRKIGFGAAIFCLFDVSWFSWVLFFGAEQLENHVILIGVIALISAPIGCLYLLPVFIGRYPSWMVRLFGRQHLLKLIDDCKRHLGDQRAIQAKRDEPITWWWDMRVYWGGVVIVMFLLGLITALVYQ